MDTKNQTIWRNELLARYRHNDDRAALETLMESLEPLIIHAVKKYRRYFPGAPHDLCVHIARVGAFHAIRTYRPGTASLSTRIMNVIAIEFMREATQQRTGSYSNIVKGDDHDQLDETLGVTRTRGQTSNPR